MLQQRRAPRQRNGPRQQRLHSVKAVLLRTLSTCCAFVPGSTLATGLHVKREHETNWAAFGGGPIDAGLRASASCDNMQAGLQTEGLQPRVRVAQWVPQCSPGSQGRCTTHQWAADGPAGRGRARGG